MKTLIMTVALVAGCAGARSADRHGTQPIGDSRAFNVMPLRLAGVREGDLAAREPSRLPAGRSRLALEQRLGSAFAGQLGEHVRVRPDAPLTILPKLTLADPAGFEGLAPETADAVLEVWLVDCDGRAIDNVTLRATADAPLARQSSRDERLERAVRRLADRYAARLTR
jgi:hypothetical protein